MQGYTHGQPIPENRMKWAFLIYLRGFDLFIFGVLWFIIIFMKRYTSRRRKRAPRRKRTFKTKSARIGKSIQKSSYSYVKKKYTAVIPMQVAAGRDRYELTVSHVGGKNATN